MKKEQLPPIIFACVIVAVLVLAVLKQAGQPGSGPGPVPEPIPLVDGTDASGGSAEPDSLAGGPSDANAVVHKTTAADVKVAVKLRPLGGGEAVVLGPEQTETRIPAGTYRAEWVQLWGFEEDSKWIMISQGPWGKTDRLHFAEDAPTTLKLGPPLKLTAMPQYGGRNTVSIGLSIVGQGGEHYHPRFFVDRSTAPPPGVKILDEQGYILDVGRFKYG